MKLHQLHILSLLPLLGYTSAVALPRKAMLYSPHRRRDQHDPSQQIRSPKPAADMSPSAASDTLTTVAIASTSAPGASSGMFSLSTDSAQPTGAVTLVTTIPTSSSIETTISTPNATSPSSALIPVTMPTPTPLATPTGGPIADSTQTSSPSPSSSNRPWVLVGIFFLAFGLLGLAVFVLTPTRRRRAQKKRERSVKSKIGLPSVVRKAAGLEDGIERSGDVKGSVGQGEGRVGVKGCKGAGEDRAKCEEGKGRLKMEGEREDGWALQLPGYRR